ncbi:ABC transporter permease [Sneathiella glossodoripedis]|uniref:ABC transporter permease n=1 Tax=Sneathiella glossodoripedis TaxID=418853 RepID=UPI000472A824|nr:ABC transporter permease subunit [Sneathiella glossodoripedis]
MLKFWQKTYLWLALVAFAGPFIPTIIASFSFRWGWPDLLPSIWWWERRGDAGIPLAWDYIFDPVSRILPAFGNTILIAGMVTLAAAALSVPAARVMARRRFFGRTFLELYFLSPLIIPEIAVGAGILLIFLDSGLYGSVTGIVIAHLIPVLPYMFRMLVNVYAELDETLIEQAQLLSAKPWQVFIFIELPLILPGLVASAFFSILISINVFLLTFYVGKGQVDTLATLLFSKISAGGILDPVSAALTLIMVVPGVLFLLVSHRLLAKNIFSSGMDKRL